MKLSRYMMWMAVFCLSSMIQAADDAPARKRRIAILPVTSNNPRDADAQFAGELIRTELISGGVFEVIANDQVESQLKIIEKKQRIGAGSCSTKECVIDVGNALESELIFAGKLIKSSSGSILLSGRVINVVSQKEEYSASETASSNADLEKACKTLVAKLNLWVTDAKFMREMSDKEREKEKEKIASQSNSGHRPAQNQATNPNPKTWLRMGIGAVSTADAKVKSSYTGPVSMPLDVFLYNSKDWASEFALYLRSELRIYGGSPTASTSSMLLISMGISVRQVILGTKIGSTLLLPYLTVGGKFNYISPAPIEGTSTSASKGATGFGAQGGLGLEIVMFPAVGFYIEATYGYSPIGNSKANIDGYLYNGGFIFRL